MLKSNECVYKLGVRETQWMRIQVLCMTKERLSGVCWMFDVWSHLDDSLVKPYQFQLSQAKKCNHPMPQRQPEKLIEHIAGNCQKQQHSCSVFT